MSAQDGILHPIRSLSTALFSFFRPVHRRGPRPETGRRIPRLEPLEDRRMLSLTLFVDADAVTGGDGLSWDTACGDLQTALAQAASYNSDASAENDVDAIWIAEGTYTPTAQLEPGDVRSAAFSLPAGVTLYGGFAGTEATLEDRSADVTVHETILSGDIGIAEDVTDNAYTVVYCGVGIEAGLDGVTVMGGNANGSPYGNPRPEEARGGGVYLEGAVVTMANTIVRENAAVFGGGISSHESTLSITNSTVLGNDSSRDGGGICNSLGTMDVDSSRFSDNISGEGGAIYNLSGTVSVTRSSFSRNWASQGGAIYSYAYDAPARVTITDSTLHDNLAEKGGGVYNERGTLTLENATLSGNTASGSGGNSGGGVYNTAGDLFIANSTLYGNSAGTVGGGICVSETDSSVTIYNTLVAGNEGGDFFFRAGPVFGSNNLIGDGSGQSFFVDGENGNIVGTETEPVDPMLGPLADNGGPTWTHTPLPDSPVIDAGNDARAPAFLDQRGWGRFRGTVDVGAVEAQPAGIAGAVLDGLDLAVDTQVTFDPLENDFIPDGYEATLNIIGETAHGELLPNLDGTFTYTPQQGFIGDDYCTYTLDTGGGRVSNEATMLFRVLPTEGRLIVDTLLDELDGDVSEGDLSLREALAATDAGEAVYFSAALAGGLILLDSELGELLVSRDVDVAGFVMHPVMINAHGKSRVLHIEAGTTVSLMGLVLTGGYAPNSTGGHFGGGILNYGALTLSHVRVSDNSSAVDGGGIHSESSLLEITNSVIANNRCGGNYGGGIFSRSGTLTVTDSTIVDNEAQYGGGICCVGYPDAPSAVTLTDSVFARNEAYSSGGALLSFGRDGNGVVTVTNCLFEGNSASYGGAIESSGVLTLVNSLLVGNSASGWGGGLRLQPGSVNTVVNSTVTANMGREGGGVYSQGETTVVNSIIAGNESEEGSETFFELTPESGHNLIGFDPGFVRNPSPGADELWGTEDDDRGDLRLKATSPAINAGESGAVPEGLIEDFGGDPRVAGGRVDIGAFEFQSTITPGRETPAAVVTTAEDVVDIYDDAVSLREALYYHAIGGFSSDTITFDPELDGLTLVLAGEELHLDGSVHVDASMLRSFTIDAGGATRVFNVANQGSEASLSNFVITGGASRGGGGIYNAGTLDLANVLLIRNSAESSSGGAILNSGSLSITNTTIADNAAYASGAIYNLGGSLELHNSIIWQNGDDPIHSDEYVASNNLIGIDPRFVDPNAGDYRLTPGSPAIDTGDNTLAIDAQGRPLVSDLSGGARIVGGTVDLGAYEFIPPGPGDLNADGDVDSTDLNLIRANWGRAVVPGSLMEGDASGDGSVNSADLDIVRANWGTVAPTAAAHVKAHPATRAGIRAKAASDAVFATLYGPARRGDFPERGSKKEPETLRVPAEAAWIWIAERRP